MPKRAIWICGLFAAELVLIVLAFQVLASVECRQTTIELACRGLRGAVLRALCLGALLAVYLWAAGAARAQFARIARARQGGRGWIVLHALAFAAVFVPLLAIDAAHLNATFGAVFPLLATGAGLMVLGGLFWLAAPADWMVWLKDRTGVLAVLALLAMVLPDLAAAIGPLWYWNALTEITFIAVALLLSVFAETVMLVPARQIIGMNDFAVAVADSCSGIEGFALITVFLGIYAWLFRDTLRMGRYWAVVLPLALLASWVLNVIRIALLIAVGAFVSPQLAANGFHSFAGWLFFILLAFAVLIVVNRARWLQREGARPAAEAPPLVEDEIAARILPFIVFMLSGVVVQAFWPAPELGYPLQALTMALALWLVRRPLMALWVRPDAVAVAGGLAVAALWLALAPAAGAPSPALAALSGGAFALWAAIRILGTVCLVPVIEELFFRGYVQTRLDDGTALRRVLGIAVSAGFFALLHGRWLEAGLAGVMFSLIYLRRGRLFDAITAHAVANAVIAAVAAWRGDWTLI